VDDVYVQVGRQGYWDFTAGRFMTWRVYRKGLGWDLYTLEDTGAAKRYFADNNFYVHTYEVDDIFYRDTPGRLAFHAYPTPWSAFELVGQYGKQDALDVLGTRAAAGFKLDHVSVAAAAEYQRLQPTVQQGSNDPTTGAFVACDLCGVQRRWGGGGGVVLTIKPIEAGFNAAAHKQEVFQFTTGGTDTTASAKTTSLGGYLELDVGTMLIDHKVILGGGLNRTERLSVDTTFERHTQVAGYIGYPLGFNNAMVKLVLTEASGTLKTPNNDGFLTQNDKAYAARIRVKFDF
jgi:hypothetical protein